MIALSILAIAGGIVGVVLQDGFNLGIDFQAGLSQRVQIMPDQATASARDVRNVLSDISGVQVQSVGPDGEQQYTVRVRDNGTIENFSNVMAERVLNLLRQKYGEGAIKQLENAYVGPQFSQNLVQQSILLVVLSLGLILVYIWFRFRLAYAFASIIALMHDVTIMIGFIGTFQIEVSTATIAAVLTIAGYSLNDTIVVFDRIRENEGLLRESPYDIVINTSVTQSLSRTLITSGTTLLAVLSIYFFAVGVVKDFALNLIVGIVVGTYSSIFIASPILLGWQRGARKRRRKKEVERYGKGATSEGQKKELPAAPTAAPADQSEIAPEAVEAVKKELGQKRQSSSAGKNVPRAKRKKKK